MKFEISLFKFDYKSDYLPYYTKHFLDVDENNTILYILNKINEEHPLSFDNSTEAYVVINEIYTSVMTKAKDIKEAFGKDLKIEPLSIRRACNDLLINEDDFNEKLMILKPFLTLDIADKYINQEFKNLYKSYKPYFYASHTMSLEYNYIGDAILLLASDLTDKFPKKESEILKAIKECDYGVEYHTDLTNRVFNFDKNIEEKIVVLKNKLNISKEFNAPKSLNFGEFKNSKEIKYDFNEFNLAYYKGSKSCNETLNLLDSLKATKLKLKTLDEDIAKDTFHINPNFTYKIASKIMLDAFDNGADLIIVDNEQDFFLFDSNRKDLEKVAGREITLPVIHKNELEKLAIGDHESVKQTLKSHSINPEII